VGRKRVWGGVGCEIRRLRVAMVDFGGGRRREERGDRRGGGGKEGRQTRLWAE